MTNLQIYKSANVLDGQSLFEVVVALAISALVIAAIVSLTTNSVRNSTYSKNNSLAATYAQQATEWLRGQRDENPANFFGVTAVNGNIYCLSDLSWTNIGHCGSDEFIGNTPFKREVSFADCTTCTKTVIHTDVTVSWQDSQGIHEVRSATDFADWRER